MNAVEKLQQLIKDLRYWANICEEPPLKVTNKYLEKHYITDYINQLANQIERNLYEIEEQYLKVEVNKIRCNMCNELINKNDEYCSFCGCETMFSLIQNNE